MTSTNDKKDSVPLKPANAPAETKITAAPVEAPKAEEPVAPAAEILKAEKAADYAVQFADNSAVRHISIPTIF